MAARGFAHEELLRVEFDEMLFMLGAVVGAVGEHALVFVIEQFFKDLAVVDLGGCGSGTEDALGFQVGFHVVLPPGMRFVVLLGPTCFTVFLATHGRMGGELLGELAFLDALVRITVVALTRGVHKTGIYDAAFADDNASALEHLAEGVEELASAFAAFGLKALFEVPERFGVQDEVLLLVLSCGSVSCHLTWLPIAILQRTTWGFEVFRCALKCFYWLLVAWP
jgi:hypothetical protein